MASLVDATAHWPSPPPRAEGVTPPSRIPPRITAYAGACDLDCHTLVPTRAIPGADAPKRDQPGIPRARICRPRRRLDRRDGRSPRAFRREPDLLAIEA